MNALMVIRKIEVEQVIFNLIELATVAWCGLAFRKLLVQKSLPKNTPQSFLDFGKIYFVDDPSIRLIGDL